MARRRRRALKLRVFGAPFAAAAALVGLLTAPSGVSRAAEVGFVYVPANLGGGSAGHGALVIDDAVFHIQNRGDGLVYFVRDRWEHFRHIYADLKNRPLHVAYVEVSDADRERILDQLSRTWVAQQLALEERDELRSEVRALTQLTQGADAIELETAGLVAPAERGDIAASRLSARLLATLGIEPLESALAQTEARLADSASERAPPIQEIQEIQEIRGLRELLLLRESLRAALHSWPLARDAKLSIEPAFDTPLEASERAALEGYADRLLGEWTELFHSKRLDRGRAMLLTWARGLAVQESLATNRLVLLNALPPPLDARAKLGTVPADSRRHWIDQTGQLLLYARPAVLSEAGIQTPRYNQLETLASMLDRFVTGSEDVALNDPERLRSPARSRPVELSLPDSQLDLALAGARARLARIESAISERYDYDLLARNCITELERATLEAFPEPDAARAALGGSVSPDELFAFIPFVFFGRVVERMRVVRTEQLPSYRTRRLARETTLRARFRESFAPWSEIYVPRSRDGDFLLFTDDVFWRRPLYGVANLAWGTLHLSKGVLALPWDRGKRMRSGASGVVWSIPELFFVNIRKGTFDWVEAEAQTPATSR